MADGPGILLNVLNRSTNPEGLTGSIQQTQLRGVARRAEEAAITMRRAEGLLNAAKAAPTPEIGAKLFNQAFRHLLPDTEELTVTAEQLAPGLKFLEALNDQPPEVRAQGLMMAIEQGVFQFRQPKADAIEALGKATGEFRKQRREAILKGLEFMQTGRRTEARTPGEVATTRQALTVTQQNLEQQLGQIQADLDDPLVSDNTKENLRQQKDRLSRQLMPFYGEQSQLAFEGDRLATSQLLQGLSTEALEQAYTALVPSMLGVPTADQRLKAQVMDAMQQGNQAEADRLMAMVLQGKDFVAFKNQVQAAMASELGDQIQTINQIKVEARDDVGVHLRAQRDATDSVLPIEGLYAQGTLGVAEVEDLQNKEAALGLKRQQYAQRAGLEDEAATALIQGLSKQKERLDAKPNASPRDRRQSEVMGTEIELIGSVRELMRFNPYQIVQNDLQVQRLRQQIATLDESDPEQAAQARLLERQAKEIEIFNELAKRDRQTQMKRTASLMRKLTGQEEELVQDHRRLTAGMAASLEFTKAQDIIQAEVDTGKSAGQAVASARKTIPSVFDDKDQASKLWDVAKEGVASRDNPWTSLPEPIRRILASEPLKFDSASWGKLVRTDPETAKEVRAQAEKTARTQPEKPLDFGDARESVAKELYSKRYADLTNEEAGIVNKRVEQTELRIARERGAEAQRMLLERKAREELSDMRSVETLVDELDALSQPLITAETGFEGLQQGARLYWEARFGDNFQAAAYRDFKSAFAGTIQRTLGGERGVLTDRDIDRVVAALPGLTDTKRVRDFKINAVRTLINVAREAKEQAINFNIPIGNIRNDPAFRSRIDRMIGQLSRTPQVEPGKGTFADAVRGLPEKQRDAFMDVFARWKAGQVSDDQLIQVMTGVWGEEFREKARQILGQLKAKRQPAAEGAQGG